MKESKYIEVLLIIKQKMLSVLLEGLETQFLRFTFQLRSCEAGILQNVKITQMFYFCFSKELLLWPICLNHRLQPASSPNLDIL